MGLVEVVSPVLGSLFAEGISLEHVLKEKFKHVCL